MYLLDTVALSEQQRPAPDVGVERFFDSVPVALMYTSVVVLGEIWRGILGDPQVARRNRLERWFDELLVTMEAQTLPITTEVCLVWGGASGSHRRSAVATRRCADCGDGHRSQPDRGYPQCAGL